MAAGASEEDGKSITDEDNPKLRSGVEYPRHNTPPLSLPSSSFVPPAPPTSRKMSPPPSPAGNKTNPNANQHAGTNPQTLGQGTNPQTQGQGTLAQTSRSGNVQIPSTQQTSATIKVMPSGASVREFTYSDADYSARNFIELCENVMRNSGIHGPVDKIAPVSARVIQGSEACKRTRFAHSSGCVGITDLL